VFQWRPEAGEAWFVNVLDIMHDVGLDDWLAANRLVPPPVGPEFDPPGKSWADIVASHQELMTDPDMRRIYYSAPDPVPLQGLPTSRLTEMGRATVQRFQRAVMQKWKTAQPWAAAGEVTVANGGALAAEVGLIDQSALAPVAPPAPPPAGAAPAAT